MVSDPRQGGQGKRTEEQAEQGHRAGPSPPSKDSRVLPDPCPPFTSRLLREPLGVVLPEMIPSSIIFICLTKCMGTDPSLGLGEGRFGGAWSSRRAREGGAWGACQRNAVELLGFQGNCAGPRIPSSASWKRPESTSKQAPRSPACPCRLVAGGGAGTSPPYPTPWPGPLNMTGHSAQLSRSRVASWHQAVAASHRATPLLITSHDEHVIMSYTRDNQFGIATLMS